ncbi:MAG: hypothetical protein GQ569_14285 [Methylococcaceae bacterium]|nr:hypothetical protein [Methylococcaceae bacterium]
MFCRLLLCLGCLFLWACGTPKPLKTANPPLKKQLSKPLNINVPLLRLNTKMHTAQINRSAIDAQQRYLVTVSHDKTARVWSLKSGELLQVLRVPIGLGNEGHLYAVAMSPDGETVAVAGKTGAIKNRSIYIFERRTGRVIKYLTGLPNVVKYLDYSNDGQSLVAALGGANGVRVYDTKNYHNIFSDRDYGSQSAWADFSKEGLLITSSYDGYLRLYGKNSRLLVKEMLPDNKKPFSVVFSPQGDKIAVSVVDSTDIYVLSTSDLSLSYRPDTSEITNGRLNAIAWSVDGNRLFAAGSYEEGSGKNAVVVWETEGRGKHHIWRADVKTIIQSLHGINDGSLLVTASDPIWTWLNQNGTSRHSVENKVLQRQQEIADFRKIYQGEFTLLGDASQLVFGVEYGGKQAMSFDIAYLRLSAPFPDINLKPPLMKASAFKIENWRNQYKPSFNEEPFKLKAYEISRSLAVSHDDEHFLLGTSWYLQYFDKKRKRLWRKAIPSTAWGVNIAANNKVAVAALGDGTLRWYRLQDGEELLALFVHPKDKRWVLWTPKGHYTASVGGESLLGWHINRGQNQAADFFEIGQFGSQFYRPDIIAKVLPQLDVNQAIILANRKRQQGSFQANITENSPPKIDIIPLNNKNYFNKDNLTLHYQISNASHSIIKNLRVLMNGRVMPAEYIAKVSTLSNGRGELKLHNLPSYSFNVGLVAENDRGLVSKTATIDLQYVVVNIRGREEIIKAPN